MPAPMWPFFVSTALASLEDKGYPACAGITIAKHNFPINRLVLMAEDMVKSAKCLSRYRNNNKPAIDWHIHQESAFSDPMIVRKRNYLISAGLYNDFHAACTRRPYTLEKFNILIGHANLLTKSEYSISNRKLYALYQALRKGPKKTQEVLKYIFLRDENDRMEKYKYIWDEICNCPAHTDQTASEYHLWELVKDEAGIVFKDSDGKQLYDTQWTDIIELKWSQDGTVETEEGQ
jgi:hypothetical protein